MVALELARAGVPVTVLERGDWARRDDSAWDPRAILIERRYRSATPYEAHQGIRRRLHYPNEAVGGNSVFYGAASFRLRERDFEPSGDLPRWPIRYGDLEPHYAEVERLLGVVGVAGVDPTEPPRSGGYAAAPPPYSPPAERVARACEARGLHPFPIPLAINFDGRDGRERCVRCLTCDLFPCKIGAKNDLSVTVLPEAMRRGAVVRPGTVARRLIVEHGRVTGVECVDTRTSEAFAISCAACVVSCGAISSAALLLASGLGECEPNGSLVGRHLMRHCSGVVIGLLPQEVNPSQVFHKQVAISDFYFGDGETVSDTGRLGIIQGLQVPPPEWIRAEAPFPINLLGAATVKSHLYLLCLAEDLPRRENRVELDSARRDPFGMPLARVFHAYQPSDLRARRALYRQASRILRAAGAWIRVRKPIHTFSHALGTCRFGDDPREAVLDPWCRYFGIPNLFVVDGSFMPTSGGVNPSLTIAANGLRVGRYVAREWRTLTTGGRV
ncbi:MAG: GMC family oxidoreductase [Gemmatimonadetes bacterium]|nr:GMC family oxidoreductase [Gemmatimonadota bacterium]